MQWSVVIESSAIYIHTYIHAEHGTAVYLYIIIAQREYSHNIDRWAHSQLSLYQVRETYISLYQTGNFS